MSYHNTKSGRCFPSEKRLAVDLDCTDRTIRTAVKELTDLRYIVTKTKAGEGRSSQYNLWIPAGKKEYKKAENYCRHLRKKTSAKQMNELMKEQQKLSITPGANVTKDAGDSIGSAKKIEQLQSSVIDALGGGAEAWELLLAIDQTSRDQIESSYVKSETRLPKATGKYVDAIRKADDDSTRRRG